MRDGQFDVAAHGHEFITALCSAGVIADPADTLQRVVIDARVGDLVKIYTESTGGRRLLNVALTLEGVRVEWSGDASTG